MIVLPGVQPRTVPGLDGDAASRLWNALADQADLSNLASASGLPPPLLETALNALVEAGAVVTNDPAPATSRRRSDPEDRPCRSMVLGVCGGAQAILTPVTVRRLLSRFTDDLDVVLSSSAEHVVSRRALSLLGARVWTDAWQETKDVPVPHIHIAEAAELVLVVPASAHALFRFGHATCEDLLSLVVAATSAPVVLVPSMNPAMWANGTVQRNVGLCRNAGLLIVEPGPAKLVCSGMERAQQGGAGLTTTTPHMTSVLAQLISMGAEA
jgi:hypothetical protein